MTSRTSYGTPVIPWRLGLLCLAAFAEWTPARPPDVLGVVTGLGPGGYGWEAMVEARGDVRYPAGEPTRVYFGSGPPPRLRVGCHVRVWFQDGMVLLSYPGQAWAEALRVDNCPKLKALGVALTTSPAAPPIRNLR